jgi:hypothetical protein
LQCGQLSSRISACNVGFVLGTKGLAACSGPRSLTLLAVKSPRFARQIGENQTLQKTTM